MVKLFISTMFCLSFLLYSKAQQISDIYSNEYYEEINLSANITGHEYEKDSLILYKNGKYQNYYFYSSFDEIGYFRTSGDYEILENKINLYPKIEYLENGFTLDISNDFEEYYCKIISRKKIKCFRNYRNIKFLKKRNFKFSLFLSP